MRQRYEPDDLSPEANRQRLLDALTVERFTYYVPPEPKPHTAADVKLHALRLVVDNEATA